MSDEITRLIEENRRLNEQLLHVQSEAKAQLLNVQSEAKTHRIRRKKAVEELNALKSQHETASKELERYKAEPSELQSRLEQLQGEIRTGKHKSRFSEVAKGLKVREDALEDLWSATGWRSEGDEPDVEQLSAAVKAALEKRPYMIAREEAQAPVALQPGPVVGRGSPVQPTIVDDHRFRDPVYMYEHGAKLTEAHQNGNLIVR